MLVSVIIPTYNVEKYIVECLDSVLKQSYDFIEVIVVDNNSTDNTLEKVVEFKNEHKADITILKEFKQGAPAARNKGTISAQGEWIQYLDADDLLKPQKIEHQVNLLKQKQETSNVVFGSQEYWFLNGKKNIFTASSNDIYSALFESKLGNTSSSLFRKEIVFAVGLWNEQLSCGQEYDLFFKILQSNKTSYLIDNAPNTIVRERASGQISFTNEASNTIVFLTQRKDWAKTLSNNEMEWLSKHNHLVLAICFKYLLWMSRHNEILSIKYYATTFTKQETKLLTSIKIISTVQRLGLRLLGFKKSVQMQNTLIRIIRYFS